jgi:hypothetical protein
VRLGIINHLHAMLDGSQEPVRIGQSSSLRGIKAAGGCKRGQRVKRCRRPYRRVAAAVDHLLDLGEELNFANPAPAALEIEARRKVRSLREMIANAGADLADFLNHSEVERPAPHEWPERRQKMPA